MVLCLMAIANQEAEMTMQAEVATNTWALVRKAQYSCVCSIIYVTEFRCKQAFRSKISLLIYIVMNLLLQKAYYSSNVHLW